jgi:iron complex transport system ATP-binding protein
VADSASDAVLLSCEDLSCGYDGRAVLESVSFSVRAGESVALLGPNGSGKSTLLRVVSKTLQPITGRVALAGRAVGSMSHLEVARLAAFVPQEETPQFPFGVRDVVTMGRLPHSAGLRDTPEDYAAATEAMRAADCLSLESRPVTELSGGERQRVLLARALAQATPLLLLDEPTAHLDIAHQLIVARMARQLAGAGKAVLSAVHDLNLVSSMASRVLLLGSGRLVLDAPVEEALSSPVLDEVYGVRFTRIRLDDGRLALFAA